MRRALAMVLLVVLFLPWTACTTRTAEETEEYDSARQEADMQAIERLNERWESAELAGNVEELSDLITDDYVRMDPDRPVILGKGAFLEHVRPFFEDYTIQESTVASEEVRIAGDWAYVRGIYRGIMVPKGGGEPVALNGKWIDIRERQVGGTWKISRVSFSNDQPLKIPE